MRRRTVLTGLLGTVMLSGCLGQTNESQQSTTTTSGTEEPTNPIVQNTCPSFRDADVTVCSQTDEPPIPLRLRPASSTFRVDPGGDTVETLDLTLENASGQVFGFNPYDWRVDRFTGDAWTKVAPEAVIEPWTTVPPGGAYEYVLTTHSQDSSAEDSQQIVVDLTTGVHAVSVIGKWGEDEQAKRVECVALVEIVDA